MAEAQLIELAMANPADLQNVLALIRECDLLEGGVAEAIDSFLLARSAGAVLGCAGLETYGTCGLLRSVAVSELARGNGLGTRLVHAVAATARSRGLSELFLLTTTASGFFERRGFHVVARSTVPPELAQSWEFRVGCPQTAVAMRCALMEARS